MEKNGFGKIKIEIQDKIQAMGLSPSENEKHVIDAKIHSFPVL